MERGMIHSMLLRPDMVPALLLCSCREIRPIGFVGTLTGPSSEFGTAGRDKARVSTRFGELEPRRPVVRQRRMEVRK